jgi:TonB family protein
LRKVFHNGPPCDQGINGGGAEVADPAVDQVRALIGVDGTAQKAEIKQSSGFDRLDQAALTTALRWRYVPGKRAGIPQAMWFTVPINFVLE